jgi:RNA polymerase sigma-70 factor, ECF subfamily
MSLRGRESTVRVSSTDSGVDDLVRRAQAGEVDAFESLYRTHAAAVLALCRRMVGDETEARDLMQDVFVRAWERLTSFRGQSAFGTWLHRLAVNVVLEHLRSTRRDAARTISDADEETFGGRSNAADLDTQMDVSTALEKLPLGARTVFVLHDMEGYSHDEIAQMTGTAAGTARAQLWRARRTLMKLLAV